MKIIGANPVWEQYYAAANGDNNGVELTAMRWTTTPPTEPGWYWAKEEDGDPECVLLQTRHGVATSEPFYVRAIGAEWDMRRTDFTHWLGPLPPPEAPKEGG